MSFFGILASIFSCGVLFAETCKDSQYTANNKKEAIQQGRLTYGDGKGREYLVSTGEKVYTHGGNIYSSKHPTTVLYDGWKQYYMDINARDLAEAKAKEKKYVLLYYPDSKGRNGYSGHYTEVSTMKRFRVDKVVYMNKEIHDWDWSFYKVYYDGDDKYNGEAITINRKEFEELGGHIPYGMSATEYNRQERIRKEKEYKKIMKGL